MSRVSMVVDEGTERVLRGEWRALDSAIRRAIDSAIMEGQKDSGLGRRSAGLETAACLWREYGVSAALIAWRDYRLA